LHRDPAQGWPGRSKGSPAHTAIALHTRSEEHYVAATASIHGTWGVAFGAVAPEIERVAVRNQQRELFAGKIIPLPPSFGEEYRAAWGMAAKCDSECELIGFDRRARLVTQSMIRLGDDRELSAEESLELIRQHCDNGLRYFAWALKRMPSIPEQAEHVGQVRNAQHALALVLAYVEGASEVRNAVIAANEITLRYIAMVEAERWVPPFASEEA
jgi:hypothetical protein